MSKTKEKMFSDSLQLKSEHLDAMHLINRFMKVCRNIDQTPKQFEKSMKNLYEDAREYGF
tara:strand:+ start:35 stop:214 length:180 start_codon:yes stop_codon:yes gene_type:complete